MKSFRIQICICIVVSASWDERWIAGGGGGEAEGGQEFSWYCSPGFWEWFSLPYLVDIMFLCILLTLM